MKAKRTYKDSLFRNIFNDKKRLASLYRALTGETIRPRDIRLTTLRGVFYNDIKNDISFRIGDRDVILMEHQSSWNPNMPLRMLWYLGKNCYNINYDTPSDLLDGCYELRCHSIFVQKVRDGVQTGLELSTAIRQAIAYCKTHDILVDYFQKNESEVFDMVNFKWDQKRALEIAKEDSFANGKDVGKEEGIIIGERKATLKIALSLLKQGLKVKDIIKATNLSLEEVRKIARDNNLVCS